MGDGRQLMHLRVLPACLTVNDNFARLHAFAVVGSRFVALLLQLPEFARLDLLHCVARGGKTVLNGLKSFLSLIHNAFLVVFEPTPEVGEEHHLLLPARRSQNPVGDKLVHWGQDCLNRFHDLLTGGFTMDWGQQWPTIHKRLFHRCDDVKGGVAFHTHGFNERCCARLYTCCSGHVSGL